MTRSFYPNACYDASELLKILWKKMPFQVRPANKQRKDLPRFAACCKLKHAASCVMPQDAVRKV